MPPLTREVWAANARLYINTQFSAKQQVFLDFVLQHYMAEASGIRDVATGQSQERSAYARYRQPASETAAMQSTLNGCISHVCH